MPGVNPSLPHSESYLCTGVQVSLDKVLYITGKVLYITGKVQSNNSIYRTEI